MIFYRDGCGIEGRNTWQGIQLLYPGRNPAEHGWVWWMFGAVYAKATTR